MGFKISFKAGYVKRIQQIPSCWKERTQRPMDVKYVFLPFYNRLCRGFLRFQQAFWWYFQQQWFNFYAAFNYKGFFAAWLLIWKMLLF